jgi:diguanylate cyclase (GGDEF)-like protein
MHEQSTETYPVYLNIFWLVSIWLILWAAFWVKDRNDFSSPPNLTLPAAPHSTLLFICVLAGVALIYLQTTGNVNLDVRFKSALFVALLLFLFVLVRQNAVLSENERLFAQIEKIAITDSLTGLYNRRHLDGTLEREVGLAHRHKRRLSVIMMDVDNFKNYNDVWGHQEGDLVLKRIAAILTSNFRKTDIIFRYGGDEFLAILPETAAEDARNIAQSIKNIVSSEFAQYGIGLSVGVADLDSGMTAGKIVSQADRALYKAKQQKNQPKSKAIPAPNPKRI